MPRLELRTLLRHIHHLAGRAAAEPSDRELLAQFAGRREEAAFAALVQRHGPLILNLCRRLLRHEQDAEDVFQATFLVLARKAGSVGWHESIAAWLHAVAHRLALKARAQGARRERCEQQAARQRAATASDDLSWRELAALLEEELARLPERYRAPLLLCCWEGRARDEAARILGWTPGMVKGRLERGREMLRKRLARRGVVLSASLLAVGLARGEVPASLAESTVRLAILSLTSTARAVPPAVAALADSALAGAKIKVWGAVLAVVLLAAGAGMWTHPTWGGPPAPAAGETLVAPPEQEIRAEAPGAPPEKLAKKEAEPQVKAAAPTEKLPRDKPPEPLPWPRKDADGMPLPAGVAQRFGSIRLVQPGVIKLFAFSPDGKMLATAGLMEVIIWDTSSGKELKRIPCRANCLAFSPKGTKLAVGGWSKDNVAAGLFVWNTETGDSERIIRSEAAFKGPHLLAFAPDGKSIWAYGREGSKCFLVEGRGGNRAPLIEDKAGGEKPVAMVVGGHPDFPFVVLAGQHRLRMLDGKTGKILWQSDAEPAGFTSLAANKDVIAAGTEKGQVLVLDTTRGGRVGKPLRKSDGPILGVGVAGPESEVTVTSLSVGRKGLETSIWHPNTSSEPVRVLLEDTPADVKVAKAKVLRQPRLSPNGKLVAMLDDGLLRVRLWDAATGKVVFTTDGPNRAVRQVALEPDGKSITCVDSTGVTLRCPIGTEGRPRPGLGSRTGVDLTALSADGKMVAIARPLGTIGLWDGPSSKWIGEINAGGKVRFLALAPDGKTLAYDSVGGTYLRRVSDKASRSLDTGKERTDGLAFSADGQLLATVNGGRITLWDVARVQAMRSFRFAEGVWSTLLAFDPRGQYLAAAHKDSPLVTLFDVATVQKLRECVREKSSLRSLTFALNGRLLVTGDQQDLTFWETASGKEVLHLSGHRGPITALAASADGSRLVSGSDDTTALLWDLRAAWKETEPEASKEKAPPSAEDHYHELHGEPARAFRAVFALAARRDLSLDPLKKEILVADKAVVGRLRRLVKDLADADPKVRLRAIEEVHRIGAPAECVLRQGLATARDEKLQARLRALLADLEADGLIDPPADACFAGRIIGLLELLDTAPARALLKQLAQEGRTGALQEQAQEAVECRTRQPHP